VHLPAEAIQVLEEINRWLEKLILDKEEAIAEMDFDKAALLREKVDDVKRKVREVIEELRVALRESQDESS
jgi:hypothetical protein